MSGRWPQRCAVVALVVTLGLTTMGADSCGTSNGGGGNSDQGGLDPTPKTLDGSSSQEFETGDIARAEGASQAVQDYCAGAVSEAQRIGCMSHVDESDIP
jgi:hypothetical protein